VEVRPAGNTTAPELQVPRPGLPRGRHDPAIAPLLSRLSYKPDPYATQPGCISEPKSQLRESFALWVEMSLTGEGGAVRLADVSYAVTTGGSEPRDEPAESLGIPRLELKHRGGRLSHVDFEGAYREPEGRQVLRSEETTPRDPTWVRSWLASAAMTQDVVAHRIVLDGRVLQEVNRPDAVPHLSAAECDDTGAEGLKLSWLATSEDAQVPLLVEVLRYEGGEFQPELPSAPAREVSGFFLLPREQGGARRDLVLLVTLTDTFRFVTRGVLVPKKAL